MVAVMAARRLLVGLLSHRASAMQVHTGVQSCAKAASNGPTQASKPTKKPKTPQGRLDEAEQSNMEKEPLQRFPDDINPITKEKGGPRGPEPTRYGDWERKGRCIDF